MICRGGLVVGDGLSAAGPGSRPSPASDPIAAVGSSTGAVPWLRLLMATAAVAIVLTLVPGRASVPQLIESDYCYQLTAANRLLAGKGLTATPPVAPFQPWEWRSDWAFLTQWPAGYPLAVAGLRWMLGISARQAAGLISVVGCAAALVGWFFLIYRSAPPGLTRWLLAGAAAATSVSVGALINPSTDIIVTAAAPWLLLLTGAALGNPRRHGADQADEPRSPLPIVLCGLAAGGLVWFRYAAIFVPMAFVALLCIEWLRRRVTFGRVALLLSSAALPILGLLGANRILGPDAGTAASFNLGERIGFSFDWRFMAEAWREFTRFSFYEHRAFVSYALSAWPLVFLAAAIAAPSGRRALRTLFARPAYVGGSLLVVTVLAMLIAATTLFSQKFHYVGLERYYQPVKPLYFLLFMTPLMLIPRRVVRATLCVGLLMFIAWTVQQDWQRTYARWQTARRPTTASGYWSRCFEPNADALYEWLRHRDDADLVVVSNFHEYIALETGIPAVPIPPDRETLDRWVGRIRTSRGIPPSGTLTVLFVLDGDNRWRGHWIPDPETILQQFDLRLSPPDTPASGAIIRQYRPAPS